LASGTFLMSEAPFLFCLSLCVWQLLGSDVFAPDRAATAAAPEGAAVSSSDPALLRAAFFGSLATLFRPDHSLTALAAPAAYLLVQRYRAGRWSVADLGATLPVIA